MIKMNSTYSKNKRFKNWRARRPFWGGFLSIISGLIILWVPVQLYEVAATPGSMIVVGLLLGGITLLMGVLSYIMPKLSTLLGILAILSSALSIMGALGGFLIGTILGIIGGSLCIAWNPEPGTKETINREKQDKKAVSEVASGKEILPE
jgi:hypothetical protein